jgi:hypothetical protein
VQSPPPVFNDHGRDWQEQRAAGENYVAQTHLPPWLRTGKTQDRLQTEPGYGGVYRPEGSVPEYIEKTVREPVVRAVSTDMSGQIPLGDRMHFGSRDSGSRWGADDAAGTLNHLDATEPEWRTRTVRMRNPEYVAPRKGWDQPLPQLASPAIDAIARALNRGPQQRSGDSPIDAIARALNRGPQQRSGSSPIDAIARALNREEWRTTTVTPGHDGPGVRAYAVSSGGMTPVTIGGTGGGGSPGMSPETAAVYRANREAIGGPITQESIDRAIADGKTVFKL